MLNNQLGQAETKAGGNTCRLTRTTIETSMYIILNVGVLFCGAGSLNWTRGWVYTVVYVCTTAANFVLVERLNPGLMEERLKWRHKDAKPFDKVFYRFFVPLMFIQLTVAGIDAVRFHWWPMPSWTIYPGIIAYLIAMILGTWTMVVNPHAETSVRIQSDRGHTVISSGPYRIVRHPMYVGGILLFPAISLILGSMWALLTGLLIAVLFIWRTSMEDRMLRRELPGYEEYAAITRFRLLPGLW